MGWVGSGHTKWTHGQLRGALFVCVFNLTGACVCYVNDGTFLWSLLESEGASFRAGAICRRSAALQSRGLVRRKIRLITCDWSRFHDDIHHRQLLTAERALEMRSASTKQTSKRDNRALQAPPPPPTARRTRLISAPRTRRSRYDAAGALACARRRNDVTSSNDIGMLSCDPFCANMTVIHKTGGT